MHLSYRDRLENLPSVKSFSDNLIKNKNKIKKH